MPHRDDLGAVQQTLFIPLAEQEARAAQRRCEAFGVRDPSAEWSPEYGEAYRDAGRAWVKAEMARHNLDAILNPERYAEKGYQGELELG